MSDLPDKDRTEVERLVTSMLNKLPFTAPEQMRERVATYIETAWLRGRSAGIEETLTVLVRADAARQP